MDRQVPGALPPVPVMYPGGPSDLGFLYGLMDDIGGGTVSLALEQEWTALQYFLAGSLHCVDDADATGISYPLDLCHTNSGGTGEAGIGVGVLLRTETANVEGDAETIGWVQAQTVQVGPGVTDSNLQFHVLDIGTEVEVLRLSGRHVDMLLTPPSSADRGMLNLGDGGFAGGGGENFAGSSSGTVLGINSPSTFTGALLDAQEAGVSRLRVLGDGRAGLGTGSPTGMLHISRPAQLVPDPNFLAYLKVTGAADTFVQAADEPVDVLFDLARTVNLDTGDRIALRSALITGATYSAVGTSTVAAAATLAIAGAPAVTGGNLTITNSYALWVTGTTRFDPGDQPFVWELPQDDTTLTGGITGRIKVIINGQTRFIPYYSS